MRKESEQNKTKLPISIWFLLIVVLLLPLLLELILKFNSIEWNILFIFSKSIETIKLNLSYYGTTFGIIISAFIYSNGLKRQKEQFDEERNIQEERFNREKEFQLKIIEQEKIDRELEEKKSKRPIFLYERGELILKFKDEYSYLSEIKIMNNITDECIDLGKKRFNEVIIEEINNNFSLLAKAPTGEYILYGYNSGFEMYKHSDTKCSLENLFVYYNESLIMYNEEITRLKAGINDYFDKKFRVLIEKNMFTTKTRLDIYTSGDSSELFRKLFFNLTDNKYVDKFSDDVIINLIYKVVEYVIINKELYDFRFNENNDIDYINSLVNKINKRLKNKIVEKEYEVNQNFENESCISYLSKVKEILTMEVSQDQTKRYLIDEVVKIFEKVFSKSKNLETFTNENLFNIQDELTAILNINQAKDSRN